MKTMVEVGNASVADVDEEGRTPLLLAAMSGDLDVVRWLVEEMEAEVGAEDGEAKTAADVAGEENEAEVEAYLIQMEKTETPRTETGRRKQEKQEKALLLYQVTLLLLQSK